MVFLENLKKYIHAANVFLQLLGEVSFPKIDILDKRRFLHRTANVGELVRINREGYNNYDVSVSLCPHIEKQNTRARNIDEPLS